MNANTDGVKSKSHRTHNLIQHLGNMHEKEYKIVKESLKTTKNKQQNQSTLFNIVTSTPEPYDKNHTTKLNADLALTKFYAKNSIAKRTVEDVDFSEFCRQLNPQYVLPKRKALADKQSELADSVREQIRALVEKAVKVGFERKFLFRRNITSTAFRFTSWWTCGRCVD